MRKWSILTAVFLATTVFGQQPFVWNKTVPIKKPDPAVSNGKLVLFDVSHGGTQGAADWVIDGGFSDFADALVAKGYTVEEYRGGDLNGDGIYRFVDDRVDPDAPNEAVITFDAIKRADVFVLAETNRPLRIDEYKALKKFVDSGKGIYFVSDHYNADRNLNSWDSTEVFNGYNRSDLPRFNMAPHYGDLRNPKDATKGWLAENFGLRFRFNAVDHKPGASHLIEPSKAEGLTTGAGKVLIAAGGSLAILDPTKAKGLVYFSENDAVKSWSKVVEGSTKGLYFGGLKEGPVVAISKPSAGKAAFIGDSSPIEDKTWKYRRENNGSTKRLHAGWTSRGNAAQLSLNIVDWLANPEPYVGFDTDEHPAGFKTPEPLADIEKTDPDNGDPWRFPDSDYNPWDQLTFKAGSYGAPWPARSSGGGRPGRRPTRPVPTGPAISVAQALNVPNGRQVRVVGRVKAEFNTKFGLLLSDKEDATKTLAVQIPKSLRAQFNPRRNPAILNQVVIVTGKRDKYANEVGMKNVRDISMAAPEPAVEPEGLSSLNLEIPGDAQPPSGTNGTHQVIRVPDGKGGHLLIIIIPQPMKK